MNGIRVIRSATALARRWRGFRHVAAAIIACTTIFGAPGAWAACKPDTGFSTYVFNLDLGTIVIQPDLPVGSVIATKRFSRVQANTHVGTCTNGGHGYAEMTQGAPIAGFDSVYSTNVKGIGIRLTSYVGDRPAFYYPHTTTYSGNVDIVYFASSYYIVELIKTEAVTGTGSLTNGEVARVRLDRGVPISSVFVPANGVTIVTPSCTVDAGSRNILVQLGKVPVKNFSGVGSTAGARPFSIQLNCSAGVAAANTVFLRMDAAADPSGQQGLLQLTQGPGVATGVGIQVLDKNSVGVKFGEDALVGPSKDGSYVLPFTARYFQTAPTVTAGPANGVATFTLNYK